MDNLSQGGYKIETPSLLHTTDIDWQFVYEPAEDTFLLLDALETEMEFIMRRKPRVCMEIGSGSGVIITALSKKLHSTAHCIAIDVNLYACEMTKKTSACNNALVDVINGDLMFCFKDLVIDLVVFNPPYVVTPSEELNSEDCLTKSWAGGKNGREVIDRFLKKIRDVLSSNGFGYVLLLKENDPEDVIRFLREERGFDARVITRRKLRGEELCVVKFEKSDYS